MDVKKWAVAGLAIFGAIALVGVIMARMKKATAGAADA